MSDDTKTIMRISLLAILGLQAALAFFPPVDAHVSTALAVLGAMLVIAYEHKMPRWHLRKQRAEKPRETPTLQACTNTLSAEGQRANDVTRRLIPTKKLIQALSDLASANKHLRSQAVTGSITADFVEKASMTCEDAACDLCADLSLVYQLVQAFPRTCEDAACDMTRMATETVEAVTEAQTTTALALTRRSDTERLDATVDDALQYTKTWLALEGKEKETT